MCRIIRRDEAADGVVAVHWRKNVVAVATSGAGADAAVLSCCQTRRLLFSAQAKPKTKGKYLSSSSS